MLYNRDNLFKLHAVSAAYNALADLQQWRYPPPPSQMAPSNNNDTEKTTSLDMPQMFYNS